jgi:hypothetical protein
MVNYSEIYNQIHGNLHEGDYLTAKLQFECGINNNGSIVTSKLVDLVPLLQPVVPRASTTSGEHSEFQVTTAHAEPLRKSTHFLHQYTSPFTMLPSVLFYKERTVYESE